MNRDLVSSWNANSIIGKIIITSLYVLIFAFMVYLPLLLDFCCPTKSINVLVFAETFSADAIASFEKETGIKVNITYAEIDEQIYAKFKMNEGDGYDVVNISDFLVQTLSSEGLLHKLNHELLPNFNRLDDKLLHHLFDPQNNFSVPNKWYIYGLVYDKNFFQIRHNEMSLKYIFDNPHDLSIQGLVQKAYKVCMLDDARDAVFLTAIYLWGRVDSISPEEFKKIETLLIDQKHWVEAYTVHSAHYFLSSDVTPIALMSSNYMQKILERSNRFAFAIPKEGSMIIIENLTIPIKSKKAALAHTFINYMISDHAAHLNSSTYGYNSSNKKALKETDSTKDDTYQHLFPDDLLFKRLYIPLLPTNVRKTVEDLWIAVGLA